jgi:molybdate/tungstate transport system substrate-binding protein
MKLNKNIYKISYIWRPICLAKHIDLGIVMGKITSRKNIMVISIIAIIFSLGILQGCISDGKEIKELNIFHAGSLSGPFMELENVFEKGSNELDVHREAAGSAEAIRKITELNKEADVLASADYTLIENMMIDIEQKFATWYIQFAVNELIIAYTDKSMANDRITSDNWPNLLLRDDVNIGFSNPNLDPCGYRALMVIKLAENYYNQPNFFEDLIIKHTSISIVEEGSQIIILAPENLKPDSSIMIRPKETDLMVQLETGELDYLLTYKSLAYQYRDSGVKYISLPDEIDLSNSTMALDYSKISLQQFSDRNGIGKKIVAIPIVYGITIPKNAPHPDLAEEFIKLLLDKEGQDIFNRNGQPPIVPAKASNIDLIPESLQDLVIQK